MLASPTMINRVSCVQTDQVIGGKRFGAPWRIFPQSIINGIVKEKCLQVLELVPGIIKKGLDEADIRVLSTSRRYQWPELL